MKKLAGENGVKFKRRWDDDSIYDFEVWGSQDFIKKMMMKYRQ